MTIDSVATRLVIQMMPLLWREFQVKLDPDLVFSDGKYADTVLDLANSATSERLRAFSQQLRARLRELAGGPAGAVRSTTAHAPVATLAPLQAQEHPAPVSEPTPAKKYVRSLR